MSSVSTKVGSAQLSSQHALEDCLYEVYALECEPEWHLPQLYEPRLSLKSRDYPLTEVPKSAFRHRYYHQSAVYDSAVPHEDRKHVPAWKVFADAADTVYYVGQTEDFDTRIAEHRAGRGSNLTADASVKKVAIRQQYPQNLKDTVVEALGDDIDSKKSSLNFAVSFDVLTEDEMNDQITRLQNLRNHIQTSLSKVTLEEADKLANEYDLSALKKCVADARAERRDAERSLARRLLRVPSFDDSKVNVGNIESFAYWH